MKSNLEVFLRENIAKQALIEELNAGNLLKAQEEFPISNKINNEPLVLLVAAKHHKAFSSNKLITTWFDPFVGIVTGFDFYSAESNPNRYMEGFIGTIFGMEVYTDYWMADEPPIKFLTSSMLVQLKKPIQKYTDKVENHAKNFETTNMDIDSSYWEIYRSQTGD